MPYGFLGRSSVHPAPLLKKVFIPGAGIFLTSLCSLVVSFSIRFSASRQRKPWQKKARSHEDAKCVTPTVIGCPYHQLWDNLLKSQWRSVLRGAFKQLPMEQIKNSRDFLREQIHHATPKAFQQIVILTKSLQWGSGRRCDRGFAWGKSWGGPSINSIGNRLRTQGTSVGFILANQLENGQFNWQSLIPKNTVEM